ncbi:MAG: PspC domain-containing protein [Candidatus Aenigmatarchaeota archaeon]
MAGISGKKAKKTQKRLYRSGEEKMLFGVCGGIAEYLDVDPTIVRLAWALFSIGSLGAGLLLYIVAAIIVPRNPRHRWE